MGKYDAYIVRTWELVWYILVLVVGTCGNIVVLLVASKSKSILRSAPFNVYISSLAVVDLLISLLAVPTYVVSTSLLVREIMYFFAFWLIHVSMYLLVAICIERRKAVLYPFSTLQKQPFKITSIFVLSAFVMGFLNEVPYIYGLLNPHKHTAALTLHMIASACEIFIPMVIFIVSYIQIRRCLSNREKDLEEFLEKYKHERKYRKNNISQQMQTRKTTLDTMTLVILAFFLCILPNEILYVLLQFANITELEWGSPIYQVGVLLRFSNSFLNPILYSCRSQEFRKHFKGVFKKAYTCQGHSVLEHIRDANFNYSRLSSTTTSSSSSNVRNRTL